MFIVKLEYDIICIIINIMLNRLFYNKELLNNPTQNKHPIFAECKNIKNID